MKKSEKITAIITSFCPYPIEFGELEYETNECKEYMCKVKFTCAIDTDKIEDFKNDIKKLLEKYAVI